MNQISISEVVIPPNRQRREFKQADLQELSDSIQSVGLLHPIVLRKEGGTQILVAGERRLRAFQDIYDLGGKVKGVGPGTIPYTPLGELSPLEAMEAELEENIRRTDLTWPERVTATAKLLEFRQAVAAEKGEPSPSLREMAAEIEGVLLEDLPRGKQQSLRREQILSKHLDDKDVLAAKSIEDAIKVVKRKEQTARFQQLGEKLRASYNAATHTLINGDSLKWLVEAQAEQFDVILTDPPYGMGADEFGDSGKNGKGIHAYEDSSSTVESLIAHLPTHLFRVAKPKAHAYIFCDLDWFREWRDAMSSAGWTVFRTPFIWFKPNGFRAPWVEEGPQRRYETILYAIKGRKKVTRLLGDVLTHLPDPNQGHSAQKPVALFADLLARSITPGDSVLDPFCGTGPIFSAAHQLKCKATGIELDQGYYGISAERIKELK